MAISKLSLVSINFNKNHYNDVLLKLYGRDDFHPELSSKFTDSVAGLSAYNNDNLYEELLVRIDEMTSKYHFEVKEIECLGKEFEPAYAQAVVVEKDETKEPGVVLEVFQKGYIYKDRVLRIAMVKVNE